MSYWDFQIWIRLPDDTTERHHYRCHLGYGQDRDIMDEPVSGMSELPPRKIAFWREAPALAE
ncbi:MAG: hypothetical protein PHI73_00435 [Patescibacteria group bacterium]|nr:hypothetical protein [Patescibacteria group bacterium]